MGGNVQCRTCPTPHGIPCFGKALSLLPLPFISINHHLTQTEHTQASNPGPSGTQEDYITPFPSAAEDREFRDSDDSDSDSDAEKEEVTTRSKKFFKMSKQSTKFLERATEKPLKNTKGRQFLEQFTLPSDCDHAYPPRLDESMVHIIPDTTQKEDRLLQQF